MEAIFDELEFKDKKQRNNVRRQMKKYIDNKEQYNITYMLFNLLIKKNQQIEELKQSSTQPDNVDVENLYNTEDPHVKFIDEVEYTIHTSLNAGYIGSDEKMFDITYLRNTDRYNLIQCSWREYFKFF